MEKTKIKIATEDKRGNISDIFYKENINHVAVVNSKKGALRGDHYHKHSTQSMYMAKGSLRYYYKEYDKTKKQWNKNIKSMVIKEGEMVTTPPYEIHALEILENNQFIVFSRGKRGGRDYESDTFRVKPSLIPLKKWQKYHL